MDLAVVVQERGRAVYIKFEGHAQVETAILLREKLAALPAIEDIIIDWKDAERVHASVLQVLLALKRSIEADGHVLRIEHDSSQVREYLELCGLSSSFPYIVPGSETSASPEPPRSRS